MSSLNFLSNIEFQMSITRLPELKFYIQSATIPGISSGVTLQPSPFRNIPRHGDTLEYGDFSVRAIVDENLDVYKETWNWLRDLTYPENFDQFKNVSESFDGLYSDASLIIMDSNKNSNLSVKLYDMFPTSISPLELNTTLPSNQPSTVDITYRYDRYEIVKL